MATSVPDRKIIAVLPAYHAVKTLQQTVEAIPREWVDEIILVDDASSDDTASLARSLGITTIVHQVNTGYGGNQKTCYREALARDADIAVMVHPDFQYDPRFIPDLIRQITERGADAAFGSRMMVPGRAREGGMPLWKYIANIVLTKIENAVLGLSLTEYHSGFRAYSRELLQALPLEANADGFSFDSEIIVQLRLAGFHISEIPITTRYFKEASMIGFGKSVRYGFSILKLLLDYRLFVFGFRQDARFNIHRYPCPVCKHAATFLFYPRRGSPEMLTDYCITESAVGVHGDIFLCVRCRSAFQQLPDSGGKAKSQYEDQPCDPVYLAEGDGRRKSFRKLLQRIESLTSGRMILDIGAGPGLLLAEAKSMGWHVSGIEPSREARAFAKREYDIDLRDSAYLDQFPDDSFDAVTAVDVIEHLADPHMLVASMKRVVKPGGVILFTTPRFDSWLSWIMGDRWYAVLPAHLVYFSRAGFCALMERSGLIVRQWRFFTRYFSLSYVWYRLVPYWGLSVQKPRAGMIVPLQLLDEFEVYATKR